MCVVYVDGALRVQARSTPVSKPGVFERAFSSRSRCRLDQNSVSTAEDEAPMDHIMETYSGVDATFQESELNTFLKALDTKGASQQASSDDDHSGHDHLDTTITITRRNRWQRMLTAVFELFREYGATSSATSLNQGVY